MKGRVDCRGNGFNGRTPFDGKVGIEHNIATVMCVFVFCGWGSTGLKDSEDSCQP